MATLITSGCSKTASLPSAFAVAFRNLSLAPRRNFSSTRPAQKTATLPRQIPPYPYGPRRTFKQADTGLYGGSTIQFGNKISKGKNKGKTRRVWHPNIWKVRLYSKALGKRLKIKVQRRVLRTITKVGGLDEYLLGEKPARIKELGMFGWQLRWKVMMSNAMRKRFEQERRTLRLPKKETFEQFRRRYTYEQQLQAAKEDQARNVRQIRNTGGAVTEEHEQRREEEELEELEAEDHETTNDGQTLNPAKVTA